MKKIAIGVLTLELLLLTAYFTSLLAWINPPNMVLFPLWFSTALVGIGLAVYLFIKGKHLAVAIGMTAAGFVLVSIGGIMRLFLYM